MTMIKNFIINEKSLIKEFQSIHSTINREANSLHAIFKDNNGIVSYDSKEVNAMIKNISTSELRSFELLASFDKNDSAFFQEVKEIFKKLQMIQIKAKTHSIVAPIQKKPIFKIKPTLNQSLKKRFLSHSRNISLNKSIDNSRTFQKTHTKAMKHIKEINGSKFWFVNGKNMGKATVDQLIGGTDIDYATYENVQDKIDRLEIER